MKIRTFVVAVGLLALLPGVRESIDTESRHLPKPQPGASLLDLGCGEGQFLDFARRAVFGPPSARQQSEHDGMWDILHEIMERMKPASCGSTAHCRVSAHRSASSCGFDESITIWIFSPIRPR